MVGEHAIRHWSSTQSVIALSSGEAEYYAIVKGGANALGVKGFLKDLGVECTAIDVGTKHDVVIYTDSTAAKAMASRRGVGKVRHIEVAELWVQDRVGKGEMRIRKVKGTENPADALTKGVGKEELAVHCEFACLKEEDGRHALAPNRAR